MCCDDRGKLIYKFIKICKYLCLFQTQNIALNLTLSCPLGWIWHKRIHLGIPPILQRRRRVSTGLHTADTLRHARIDCFTFSDDHGSRQSGLCPSRERSVQPSRRGHMWAYRSFPAVWNGCGRKRVNSLQCFVCCSSSGRSERVSSSSYQSSLCRFLVGVTYLSLPQFHFSFSFSVVLWVDFVSDILHMYFIFELNPVSCYMPA